MPNTQASIPPGPMRPKPWSMCSSIEANDRTQHKELSIFECTLETTTRPFNQRRPDGTKCIKKYRRSAAGGGTRTYNGEARHRSLATMEQTVEYLLRVILSRQSSCPNMASQSLVHAVNFVDDRVRAVQVDLTTLLGSYSSRGRRISSHMWSRVGRIQARLIRYNLVIQYLLSDLDGKQYEWKFARTALTTCLTSYLDTWNNDQGLERGDDDWEELDEMLSYTALLHISTVLNKRELAVPSGSTLRQQCGLERQEGEGMSAILGLAQKYCYQKRRCLDGKVPELEEEKEEGGSYLKQSFPKYHWALQFAIAVDTGNYVKCIRILKEDIEGRENEDGDTNPYLMRLHLSLTVQARWKILSRCCMAQIMPIVRIGLIRYYNKSFMKKEQIQGPDVSGTSSCGVLH